MRLLLDLDKESSAEIEADISMFEEMFAAKVSFFDEMVANRDPESAVEIADLRQETIYEIAQFFYFMKVFRIDSAEKLRVFALSHNANIQDLLDNGSDQDLLGISRSRLKDALFHSDEMLDRLEAACGDGLVKLSQSDLARFLVEQMSTETCRAGVKILSDTGYLRLSKSPFGAVLIQSNGTMEQIFGSYIRGFRRNAAKNCLTGKPPRQRPKLKEVST